MFIDLFSLAGRFGAELVLDVLLVDVALELLVQPEGRAARRRGRPARATSATQRSARRLVRARRRRPALSGLFVRLSVRLAGTSPGASSVTFRPAFRCPRPLRRSRRRHSRPLLPIGSVVRGRTKDFHPVQPQDNHDSSPFESRTTPARRSGPGHWPIARCVPVRSKRQARRDSPRRAGGRNHVPARSTDRRHRRGLVEVVDLTAPLSESTPILRLPEPFANTVQLLAAGDQPLRRPRPRLVLERHRHR